MSLALVPPYAVAAEAGSVAASQRIAFDIAAGPLEQALPQFAAASGVTISAPPELVKGVQSSPVRGAFSVQQGLQQLLNGTGLQAVPHGTGGYVLGKTAAAQSADEATLPAVVVNSEVSATEGTGSYTTPITRTATGLRLAPRDTPQSITVVTRERMDEQAMSTVLDTLRGTTGIWYSPMDRGRGTVTSRGFSVSKFQFDGVPVETGNVGVETSNTVLYDRVEVLRGASGLLTGTGDASATVNLVRKRPLLKDGKGFSGQASVELGSWDHRAATVDLSAPLNDDASVRARVLAHTNRHDAFIDLERTRNTTFYGVVEADLTNSTQLSVGASEQIDKRYGVTWVGLPYWYSDGTRTNWSRSKTVAPNWNIWHTKEQTAFATLEHRLENRWSLRASFDYHRQVEESNLLWSYGTPDRATGLGIRGLPYHYLTYPTQHAVSAIATGPFSLLGREHEATIGFTYSRDKDRWSNRDPLSGSDEALPSIETWDGSYPEPALGERYWWDGSETTQTAIYAAARLQVSDRLKFILGGRLSQWRRDSTTPEGVLLARYEEKDVFTPYAGAVLDLNEQWSAYASYTDIFKPQTARDRNGSFLDPLVGKNYETGIKGELLDGALQVSAAVFRIEQDNYAVRDVGFFVPGTTTQAFYAARGVVSKGYELEATGALAPGWNVSAGWTHFSAKDATGADALPYHPRRQFKLFTSYRLPGEWQRLTVGGGLTWQSDDLTKATNPATGVEERVGQSAYGLVNLMARYALAEHTSLQLNVSNALDKRYFATSGSEYLWGEPRRVVVTLTHGF